MPLRSRSRASSATRNSPQCVSIARNSSSSASNPSAITPPSRTSAAGSGAIARASSVAHCASTSRPPVAARSSGASMVAAVACSSGSRASVSRRPARSRGLALRRAMRPTTRSTSMVFLNPATSARATGPSARSASVASCRAEAFACDRSGCVSQTRNSRLPAAVAQPSSNENSVGAASPDNVAVISRLRRDAGSRATNSLAVSTVNARIWASADICVVLA